MPNHPTPRPSDRAVAQAFYEVPTSMLWNEFTANAFVARVKARAVEIDSETKDFTTLGELCSLPSIVMQMRNFADVADGCTITEVVNSITAIRAWANMIEQIDAAAPTNPPEAGGELIAPTGVAAYRYKYIEDGEERVDLSPVPFSDSWVRAKRAQCTPLYTDPSQDAEDAESTRAKFERWVSKRWGYSTERWADSGEYHSGNTREWWQCCFAAIDAARAAEATDA